MKQINITCPGCSKKGSIELDEDLVENSQRGITAVNVHENIVCSHSFVAYVDKNFVVRDSFMADFTIEIPEVKLTKKYIENKIPDRDNVDVYLLTMNLNVHWLGNVIRSIFLNQKVLIINELDVLNNHIKNFFDYLFQNTFKTDISITNKQDYKNNRKQYKEHVIIDQNNLIQDKKNILNPKSMKIESKIIQKFIEEIDPKSSLIILKNEIQKAYELSIEVCKFTMRLKKDVPLNAKELNDYLSKKYDNVKFDSTYLNFLVTIVKHNYNVNIIDATHRMHNL